MRTLKDFLQKEEVTDIVQDEFLSAEDFFDESSIVSEAKNTDPPAVLVMRRKSIRVFPNGKRVALYFVDKLNKYVTVPYEEMQWSESTVIDKLAKAVKSSVIIEHLDGSSTEVTPQMAKNIIDLYKNINETNKQKMIDMLEASKQHFQTIAKFSKE